MAEGLAPKLNAAVGFEQPVSNPSLLSGVAGLSSLFLSGSPAKAPSGGSLKDVAKRTFYNELAAAKASVAQEEATPGSARTRVQRAYNAFSSDYGREEEDINQAFSGYTGVSVDINQTGQAFNVAELADRPEFAISVALMEAKFPNKTETEIYDLSIDHMQETMAVNQAITDIEQQEKVDWFAAERVYVRNAQLVGDNLRAMVFAAEDDQIITPDEAGTIRKFYRSQVQSETKPQGVDQARWDKFRADYMEPLDLLVEQTIGLAEQQGLAQDQKRAIDGIIAKAISQGKLPVGIQVRMLNAENGSIQSFLSLMDNLNKTDGAYLENYNFVMNNSFEEVLDWVTTFEDKTTSSFLREKVDLTEYNTLSGEDKRESLLSAANSISLGNDPAQLSLEVMEIVEQVGGLGVSYLQPKDFVKFFSPSFYGALNTIYEANPLVGEELILDAQNVMAGQIAAITLRYNSEMKQIGVENINGTLQPTAPPSTVKATVDAFFDGDWSKALQARGYDETTGRRYAAISLFADGADRLAKDLAVFEGVLEAKRVMDANLPEELQPQITPPQDEITLSRSNAPNTVFSGNSISLIREFEGFSENSYWDVNAFRAGFGSDTVTKADGTVVAVTRNTTVTQEDAERDLARRSEEFARTAKRQVGSDVWTSLPGQVVSALTSVSYNYGSLPDTVVAAVGTGDKEAIAVAVEGLASDNNFINADRRYREADIIRGDDLPSTAAPVYSPPPSARPQRLSQPATGATSTPSGTPSPEQAVPVVFESRDSNGASQLTVKNLNERVINALLAAGFTQEEINNIKTTEEE